MARIQFRLPDAHKARLDTVTRCFGVRQSSYILHAVVRQLRLDELAIQHPHAGQLHQEILTRAMQSGNATVAEFVAWTGLERSVVLTTLNEMLDADAIWKNDGRGKIVTYHRKEVTPEQRRKVNGGKL
jgi:hypothetical protein